MKTYILFLIKRALCRKGNWLTAGVYFLVVLLFWGMNMHAQSQIKETIQEQIRLNEQTQVLVPEYKEALDAYETKDWDSFTSTYLTILDKQKAMVWQQSEDMVEDLDKQRIYYEALSDQHLAYENMEYPVYGYTFLFYTGQTIFPALLTIGSLILLVHIALMDRNQALDCTRLFPLSSPCIVISKIIAGFICSMGMAGGVLGLQWIVCTLLTGQTGSAHPILVWNQGTWITKPAALCVGSNLLLLAGFILFLSLFVSVLSAFVKEETSLLITSVVLITGFGYAPYLIPYLQPFSHLFPTTYMHFSAIVNGWMSKQFYNGYLILTHGMYNLMIWCLGLSIWLSFYLLRTRIYRKDRR